MIFDQEFVHGGLVLGTINLVVTVAIATGVLRVLLRQRALENAWRLRLARWRQETGVARD